MKCESCGKPAVVNKYCKTCFIKYFEKEFKKGLSNLKGKSLCVAVSGGKDSLTTLYLTKKFYPKNKILALLIDEGIKGYRPHTIKSLKKYAKEWDIPYKIVKFEKPLDDIKGSRACSVCGVLRRYYLNKHARGFDVLITGHNLDDEAQATLMNVFMRYASRFKRMTMPLVTHKLFIKRIKPLRHLSEREVMAYFILKGFDTPMDECPYARSSFRDVVRTALNEFECKHPGSKLNIIKAYDSLNISNSTGHLSSCIYCNEPSSNEVCQACKILRN